jgi:small redox-active disulfide protein 2
MTDMEVTRIKVGGQPTGIIGLKEALEAVSAEAGDRSDKEIKEQLVKLLSRNNYIAEKTRDMYGQAFLREYKKFIGQPFDEEMSDGIEIKVLGQGCPRCHQLTQDLMALIAEAGINADLEHVTDIKAIASYGVMGSPGLVINGKVVSVGSVPPKAKLKELVLNAAKA